MKNWKKNVSFLLVCPREGGNIGASARAIKNFGFSRLELVAPRKFPSDEALWFAHGALDVLEKVKIHGKFSDAISGKALVAGTTRRLGKQRGPVYTLREGVTRIKKYALEGPVSILFGREDRGLSNEETEQCAFLINIPAGTQMPSFNLSQAVLLMAYELFMAGQVSADTGRTPGPDKKLASQDDISFFFERFSETLALLDYIPRGNKDMEITIMKNLKHLLGRAQTAKWELKMLHGLLSRLDARLRQQ